MTHEALTADHEERLWSRVSKGPGCWEWQAPRDLWGYGRLGVPGGKRNAMAHRVSWATRNGEIPQGLFVLHNCNNPACVRPDHLRLGTNADNMNDMFAKYRAEGRSAPQARLTVEQVTEIKRKLHDGSSCEELGPEYGVAPSTIGHIRKGRHWDWVAEEYNGRMEPHDRLSPQGVRMIRERMAAGESQQLIADSMGVSQSMVSSIKNGRTYQDVI